MSLIIPRSQWAVHRFTPVRISLPAPETWIHHTAAAMPGDHQPHSDEIAEMREIEAHHINVRGWRAIAYSFVIFDSGNIYEGRGWGVAGGHTEGHNTVSHGICFAGNFEKEQPTLASLDACRQLITGGIIDGKIKNVRQPTGGHRDTKPTACPGRFLYAKLDYLRQPWKGDDAMTPEERKQLDAVIARADRLARFRVGVVTRSEGGERPPADVEAQAGWDAMDNMAREALPKGTKLAITGEGTVQ